MTSHTTGPSRSQVGRDYLWNTAASVMLSLATVIQSVLVTRAAGLWAGGMFALAIAVGVQFQTLGMYEVRTYQATDLAYRFSFGTYLATRLTTVSAMVVGIIGYAFVSGRTTDDVLIIIMVACFKAFDAFEDVFMCEFQRRGRLDVGGRAVFFRALTTTAVFAVALVSTSDLLVSAAVTLVASVVATAALLLPPARGRFPVRPQWGWRPVAQVLGTCLPLFMALFLSMFLANAPRFAIDHYLDPTVQGYFQILFMPAFAINLISQVVFRPLLTTMATRWTQGDRRGFAALVWRGLAATAAAFALVGLVCLVVGLPLLGAVYGKDVSGYLGELMVVVTGGAVNAAGVVLYYALATMRLQRLVFAGYVAASAAVTGLCVLLVPRYGMLGAAASYGLAMAVLCTVFVTGLVRGLRRAPHPDVKTGFHDVVAERL